ncbi:MULTISPECIES: acyl-CoA dehydrogenase family protein [Bacillaceae]|uniref:acyl-CoA dehydrogenase family protein n=1 Tax=Bacillaceae TaxID=186817 RepID=UPI000C349912|nr:MULTISPECIES: acyl-CoA dehydrogenase family protein [Bacillaceae]MCT4477817.1 acyl-CoA dehydrogenase family protein [Peribacillus frigoritolerans]PKF86366.1 acyl-CoA dehydrogenase [Bacillus sp. BA3]CAH0138762.1 Acyl-CoA dehydrogenase [Peribacillus sp. Bi134]
MVSTLAINKDDSRSFLTEEHLLFKQSIREFLAKEAVPFYDQWEKEGGIPRSFWKKIGDNGFLCPWLDVEFGGIGADFGYSVVLAEELEMVGSALGGISIHSDVVAPYIATFGTIDQQQRYLPKFFTGEMISAFAFTEPGMGSEIADIQTTAIKKDGYYNVNGAKTFVINGFTADFMIVACKTDLNAVPSQDGISLLLIDKDTPGFSRGRKLGNAGQGSSGIAELFFDDALVPVGNLLGEEGKGLSYIMQKLQQEKLMCAIGSLIAAKDMLHLTMNFIKGQKAFEKKISKFKNAQFTIAEIATDIQLGRTFVDGLICKHMTGENIITEVSMAKYWITEMSKRISEKCMQLHDGYGHMEDDNITRRHRDIPFSKFFTGTDETVKILIAKNIGF